MTYPQRMASDYHRQHDLFPLELSAEPLGKAPWPKRTILLSKRSVESVIVNADSLQHIDITHSISAGCKYENKERSLYFLWIMTDLRKQSQWYSLSLSLRLRSGQTPSISPIRVMQRKILLFLWPKRPVSVDKRILHSGLPYYLLQYWTGLRALLELNGAIHEPGVWMMLQASTTGHASG